MRIPAAEYKALYQQIDDVIAARDRARDALTTTTRERDQARAERDEAYGVGHAAVGRLEEALRAGLSRLTLARASMRAAVKHNDFAHVEAWLLAAEDNGWINEVAVALGGEGQHGKDEDTDLGGAGGGSVEDSGLSGRGDVDVIREALDSLMSCHQDPGPGAYCDCGDAKRAAEAALVRLTREASGG